MKQWQKNLAELFGTFILVFVGATAIVGFGVSAAPFAFGLGLLGALYAFGETSGGHFNPIVSLVMFLDRRMSVNELLRYWLFQFPGAILGALALLLMTSSNDVAKAATVPGTGGDRAAFFVELFMSAIFVAVILQVTKNKSYGATTFVAIALTLMAIHFAAVPFKRLVRESGPVPGDRARWQRVDGILDLHHRAASGCDARVGRVHDRRPR